MDKEKTSLIKDTAWLMGILSILLSLCGCGQDNKKEEWRTDSLPITSRFPPTQGATAFTWIGGSLNKDSWLSVPGPSTIFVRCFVEGFSQAYTNAPFLPDLEEVDLPSNVKIPKNLNFDPTSKWYRSKTLNEVFLSMKHRTTIEGIVLGCERDLARRGTFHQ